MNRIRGIQAVVALLLITSAASVSASDAQPSSAVEDSWRPAGLNGASPAIVRQDPLRPSRFYLVGPHINLTGPPAYTEFFYLFRSDDGGESWSKRSLPPPGGRNWIVVSPGGRLYSFGWSVYSSDDGGDSWSRMGEAPAYVTDAVFAGNSILVANHPTPSHPSGSSDCPIWKSDDGGASWILVLDSSGCGRLAVAPSDPNVLYSGASYRSSDGGSTWVSLVHENSTQPAGSHQVAVSWYSPNTIYTTDVFNKARLHRSTDGGETWGPPIEVDALYPSGPYHVTTGPDGCILIGGYENAVDGPPGLAIATTCDDGFSWEIGRVPGLSLGWLASGPLPDSSQPGVYIQGADPTGIVRSEDSGRTWMISNEGLHVADVLAMASSPLSAPPRFVASLNRDTGRSDREYGPIFVRDIDWKKAEQFAQPSWNPGYVTDLAVRRDGMIFVTGGSGGDSWIWRSPDGGSSWTASDSGIPGTESTAYAIALDNSGTKALTALLRYSSVGGPCESYERGDSSCFSVYRSEDGGSTWSPAVEGLPQDLSANGWGDRVAFNPSESSHTVLRAGFRHFQSSDGGLTWHEEDWGADGAGTIHFEPDGTMLSYGWRGLVESRDRGETWTVLSPPWMVPEHWGGISSSDEPSRIALDPMTGRIWLTGGGGVYETSNRGISWTKLDLDWPDLDGTPVSAHRIIFDVHAGKLYAATSYGHGVWEITRRLSDSAAPVAIKDAFMSNAETLAVAYQRVGATRPQSSARLTLDINGTTILKTLPTPGDNSLHFDFINLRQENVARFTENVRPILKLVSSDATGALHQVTYDRRTILLPVIAIHGILSDVVDHPAVRDLDQMWAMGKIARDRWGYQGEDASYVTWYDHVSSSRDGLWAQVDQVKAKVDLAILDSWALRVNLIGHSMGGLIARGVQERYGFRVRGVIAVASPHQGSADVYFPGGVGFGATGVRLASNAVADLYPLWDALWECDSIGNPVLTGCLFGARPVPNQFHSVYLSDLKQSDAPFTAVCGAGKPTYFTVWRTTYDSYTVRSSTAGDGTVPYFSCAWGPDVFRAADEYDHGWLPLAMETFDAMESRFDLAGVQPW